MVSVEKGDEEISAELPYIAPTSHALHVIVQAESEYRQPQWYRPQHRLIL